MSDTNDNTKKPRSRARSADLTTLKTAVKEKAQADVAVTAAADNNSAPENKHVQKLDKHGRAYATGKRKNAIARVWIKPGSGKMIINGREYQTYFARPVLQMVINQPFGVAGRAGQYDVNCLVVGGGLSGQAGAVKHGISKALTYFEPELRGPLKAALFLRRDPRIVERKKYGHAKARKRFQFSKR